MILNLINYHTTTEGQTPSVKRIFGIDDALLFGTLAAVGTAAGGIYAANSSADSAAAARAASPSLYRSNSMTDLEMAKLAALYQPSWNVAGLRAAGINPMVAYLNNSGATVGSTVHSSSQPNSPVADTSGYATAGSALSKIGEMAMEAGRQDISTAQIQQNQPKVNSEVALNNANTLASAAKAQKDQADAKLAMQETRKLQRENDYYETSEGSKNYSREKTKNATGEYLGRGFNDAYNIGEDIWNGASELWKDVSNLFSSPSAKDIKKATDKVNDSLKQSQSNQMKLRTIGKPTQKAKRKHN